MQYAISRRSVGVWLVAVLWVSLVPASLADANRFAGTTIRIGVQDVDAIGSPAKVHAKTWEARTGGKTEVLQSDFGRLFVDYMGSLQAAEPVYDVLLFPSAWAADFFPYLMEMPRALRDSEAFDDIHPIYRDRLMTWDGKWIAATIDGDVFNGYYRKDLFEDPRNRTDFRNVHGGIVRWIKKSMAAGKPWVVACDEPGDAQHALIADGEDPDHDNARINGLWGTFMAGGCGTEWYFGYKHPHSDLTCQDWRSRDKFWDQGKIALGFFYKNDVPFWKMRPSLTKSGDWALSGGGCAANASAGCTMPMPCRRSSTAPDGPASDR